MRARSKANPGIGRTSCSVRLALVYLLLAAGQGLAQAGSPTFVGGALHVSNLVHGGKPYMDRSKIRDLSPDEYTVIAYGAADQQAKTEIRLKIAADSLVEFEPPFTWTLPGASSARIRVANHSSVDLVPRAAPYTLIIPAGIQVYRDSARTVPTDGQVLMTRATGYDTLWAASIPDISTDRTYILSILGSKISLQLTYLAGPTSIRTRLKKPEGPTFSSPLHDALGRKFGPKFKNPKPASVRFRDGATEKSQGPIPR
jgi:hypothetical protein